MNSPLFSPHHMNHGSSRKEGIYERLEKIKGGISERVDYSISGIDHKDTTGLLNTVNAVLKEKFPDAEVKILGRSKTDNTFFNTMDRLACDLTDDDIRQINSNPDGIISGEKNIYIPYENTYIVIKSIGRQYHDSMIHMMRPFMHAFRRRIIDIKQVSEDPLTHAYSKAYYDKHGSELDENTGISYSVVAIDLDKFKKINDNYGHNSGDLALKKFVEICKYTMARGQDKIIRKGGDEFVIIFEHTESISRIDQEKEVQERMEKLEKAIQESGHIFGTRQIKKERNTSKGKPSLEGVGREEKINIHFSWGVSYKNALESHKSFADIFKAADEDSIQRKKAKLTSMEKVTKMLGGR